MDDRDVKKALRDDRLENDRKQSKRAIIVVFVVIPVVTIAGLLLIRGMQYLTAG